MRKIDKQIFRLFFAATILIGCETKTPEYFFTEGGLKYKYQDLVGEGKEPQIGDVLSVDMKWSTIDDSVFYKSNNTGYKGADIVQLQIQNNPGGIEEGFAKLKEGDSVTFYINPERFFKEYIQSEIPVFLLNVVEMKIDIRLIKVQSKKEYELSVIEWQRYKEFEEFQKIEETIDYWNSNGDSIVEIDGLYIVYDSLHLGKKISYNAVFDLHYIATFTNGKEFYNTYDNGHPDEFQFGQNGQMVEGLKKAISSMKYGQKAKVLVPSEMGFKEKGSAGKIVPPHTPVIYYLEILPKKDNDFLIEK